jgi:hypothetical protein
MALSDYVDPDEDTPEAQAFRLAEALRDELALRLRGMSDEGLLKTFAALTHRIHAATRKKDRLKELDLRVQRDVVEGEILRRMRRE